MKRIFVEGQSVYPGSQVEVIIRTRPRVHPVKQILDVFDIKESIQEFKHGEKVERPGPWLLDCKGHPVHVKNVVRVLA